MEWWVIHGSWSVGESEVAIAADLELSKTSQQLKVCVHIAICFRFLFWNPQVGMWRKIGAIFKYLNYKSFRFLHVLREFVFLRQTNSWVSHQMSCRNFKVVMLNRLELLHRYIFFENFKWSPIPAASFVWS